MGAHDHDVALTAQRHQARERTKAAAQLAQTRPATSGPAVLIVGAEGAAVSRESAPQDDLAERLAQACAEIAALRLENHALRAEHAPLHQKVGQLTKEAQALRIQLDQRGVLIDESGLAARVRAGALGLIADQFDILLPRMAEIVVDDRGSIPVVMVTIECFRAKGKDFPREGRQELLAAASAARATGGNVIAITCQVKGGSRSIAEARILTYAKSEEHEASTNPTAEAP